MHQSLAKLKGFANSEADPSPDQIEAGLDLRRTELDEDGRFLMACVGNEPASVIAWYEGQDRILFHLATRVPFRNRGIAKYLLCHVLNETYESGRRSIMLYADASDTPQGLYRRLGFVDEVYWKLHFSYAVKINPANRRKNRVSLA